MSAEPLAHVNGEWVPVSQARVSVLDRGFLFADGVYEVIPAYGGRPFHLAEHLARLERSLQALRIANPHDADGWTALVTRLLDGGDGDRAVYLQVTRGAAPKRGHGFPEGIPPTVVGLCNPLPPPNSAALRDGVAAVTHPDIRWGRCDIKSVALLPNILASQHAIEQGCNEAILHRDGRVTEGASSNVYAVAGGAVVTPPKGPEILPGITRDVLLDALRGAGVPVEERTLALSELQSADEVWITSSTREVLPVTRLDGRAVGTATPGPVWKKAHSLFQDARRRR